MALRDWLVWEAPNNATAPNPVWQGKRLRDRLEWNTTPSPDPEALAERAAIMEHDGGLPRQTAEHLARLK